MHTPKRNLSEFDMSGQDAPVDAGPVGQSVGVDLPQGQTDREGAMAKADLYKLASYAHKLYEKIQPEDQLEAWVQAKITKAADYMASVYHYLEYEMKFSEYGHHLDNSDTLSESQKQVLKARLNEARAMVKQLKVNQAEKVAEGFPTVDSARKEAEAEKGTGKFDKKKTSTGTQYTRKSDTFTSGGADADMKAAKKAGKVKEGFPTVDAARKEAEDAKGTGKFDKKKTSTGTEYTRKSSTFTNKQSKKVDEAALEDHHNDLVHAAAIVAGLKRRANMPKTPKVTPPAVNAYDDIEDEGMGAEMSPPLAPERMVDPAVKGKLEAYGKKTRAMAAAVKRIAKKDYDGDGEIESEKDEVIGSRRKAAGLDEASKLKGKQKKLDVDKDGDIEADDLADLRAKKKVDEAKPSAGLSKAKKSAVVKKAKAGGDIGKPGKNFDKVVAAAKKGGAKDPKAVAAAAMWKNVKESVKVAEAAKKAKPDFLDMDKDGDKKEPMKKAVADKAVKKEAVNESVETSRMREQLQRLNRSETHRLVESSEADTIRALTQRLNG